MASTIARPVTPPDFAESRDQSSFPLSPSTARYSTGMKSSPRRRPPPSFPNSPRRREHYHQHSVSMHGDLATARAAHDWHHSQMARPGEPRRDSPPEDSHGVLQTPHMLRVPPTPETACPIPTPTMRPRRSSELVSLGDQDRQSSIGPSRSVGASSAGLGIVVGAATGSTAPRGQRPTASGATANATSPYRKRMALPSVEGRQAQASSTTSKPVRNRAGPVSRTRLLESLRDLAPQYWSMGNGDVTVRECVRPSVRMISRILILCRLAVVPFDHRAAPPCHATTSASGRQQDGRSTPAQGKMVHCYAAVPTRASGAESKCQPPPTPTSASSRASQATEQSNGALDSKDWHDDARDPERTPRRASMQFEPATPVRLPQLVAYPVMKFSMHRDFLIAQSSGLRDLLVRSRPQMSAAAGGPPPAPRPTATLRGARMLSSPQTVTPVLWLPVPDSKSFPTLVHWMYW